MNDAYAGDVGDFSKFALLRLFDRLALQRGVDLETAVLWWATRVAGGALGDGSATAFVDDPVFQAIDEQLVRALRVVQFNRCIHSLERGILRRARFHNERIDAEEPMLPRERRVSRPRWLEGVTAVAHGAGLLFVDPDNGLAPKSVGRHSFDARKAVFVDELQAIAKPSQTLVVYHHATRRKKEAEAAAIRDTLSDAFPEHGAVRVLRAPRVSPRYFAIVPARAHEGIVDELRQVVVRHPWPWVLQEMA